MTPGCVFGRVTQKWSAGGRCRPFIRQPRSASPSLTWKMSISSGPGVARNATLNSDSPIIVSSGCERTAALISSAARKMSAAIDRYPDLPMLSIDAHVAAMKPA